MSVRPAIKSDATTLLSLIKEVAAFDNESESIVAISAQTLEEDGFGPHPVYQAWLAEQDGKVAGFAFGYFSYSTGKGKGLYMEEMYLRPEYRRAGFGLLLGRESAKTALKQGCVSMTWHVMSGNAPATSFYQKFRGTPSPEWIPYSLSRDELVQLVKYDQIAQRSSEETKGSKGEKTAAVAEMSVRKAVKSDASVIASLMSEWVAVYKKDKDVVEARTVEQLQTDGWGPNPSFQAWVAEHGSKVVGYTIGYFIYSTYRGRCWQIEDLYVQSSYRRRGLGELLFRECATSILAQGCARTAWHALDGSAAAAGFCDKLKGTRSKCVPYYASRAVIDWLASGKDLAAAPASGKESATPTRSDESKKSIETPKDVGHV